MLEKIINSKARLAVLNLFFANKDREFYAQEIINHTHLDPANIHKELTNLVDGTFLVVNKKSNRKYFSLNKKSDFYEGLKNIFANYSKQSQTETWINIESMPNYYPMMVATPWNLQNSDIFFKSMGFKNRFSKLLTTYDNNQNTLFVIKDEFNKVSQEVIDKSIHDVKWGQRYIDILMTRQKKLDDATKQLLKMNLVKLSKQELYELYNKYYEIYSDLHLCHWVQTAADFGDNLFSKYLMQYLEKKIKNTKYSLGEVFSIMTTPTEDSNPSREYHDLLEILKYINSKPKLKNYFKNTEVRIIVKELINLDKKLDIDLDKHVAKYGWIGYGTIGPGWGKDYFIDILGSLIRQNLKPAKALKDLEDDRQRTVKKQADLVKGLKIDENHQRIFAFARNLVFTKGLRKDAMFFSYSVIENLYKEIGRRYYLSVGQIRYLYPHEFKDLLLKDKFSADLLNQRYKFSLQYSLGDYQDDILLEGDQAKEFLSKINIVEEKISDVKTFEGDCASPGHARGKAVIVNVPQEMENMEEGNVLISIATNPDLVPAIKKASAIITDLGGITCHAAIVSRELGIPCVIGTRVATKALKNGDLVDVDATHGKINIIKSAK